MRLIKPSFTILHQSPGLEGVYKQIELAGRTCYKSEDKITQGSAKEFAERMIKSGHGAMLEHGTVYLGMPVESTIPVDTSGWGKYHKNKYSKGGVICTVNGEKRVAITTNLRVLVENNWLDDLQYICEPTEHHEKRITVRFVCDRGVSHEFVRHRVFSFAQESTRYCNYSKNKFGKEVTFILPPWVDDAQLGTHDSKTILEQAKGFENWCDNSELSELTFLLSLAMSESSYLKSLELGWQPQQARAILPNSLKTELVMTGFVTDWPHFFDLRCATNAHPQARELAIPLYEEFINQKLISLDV